MLSPFIDSSVDNVPLQTSTSRFFEFIDILKRRLVDSLLHDFPNLVIDWIDVRVLGSRRSGKMKFGVSRWNILIVSRAQCTVAFSLSCRSCYCSLF